MNERIHHAMAKAELSERMRALGRMGGRKLSAAKLAAIKLNLERANAARAARRATQ
jgi:hypothetical protein